MHSYILCTAPRSGSTMLCKLLTHCGDAGAPESYFHRPDIDSWLDKLAITPCNGPDREKLQTALHAAQIKGRSPNGVFGLRLQAHSRGFFCTQLTKLHPNHATDRARLEATFGPLLFVYLNRKDKIAQAISYDIACQSGLWHRNADGSVLEQTGTGQDPAFNATRLKAQVAQFETDHQQWQTWFTRQGITPLQLTYERLASHPQSELNRIREALQLPPVQGIRPPTRVLADTRNQTWHKRLSTELKTS